jgi:hypothetical protein
MAYPRRIVMQASGLLQFNHALQRTLAPGVHLNGQLAQRIAGWATSAAESGVQAP